MRAILSHVVLLFDIYGELQTVPKPANQVWGAGWKAFQKNESCTSCIQSTKFCLISDMASTFDFEVLLVWTSQSCVEWYRNDVKCTIENGRNMGEL